MQAGETLIEKSVKIASVIDRGVFSAEKSYEQGDGTTYGGCYWIAQKDAPVGVPGGSDDWRLAVKKVVMERTCATTHRSMIRARA